MRRPAKDPHELGSEAEIDPVEVRLGMRTKAKLDPDQRGRLGWRRRRRHAGNRRWIDGNCVNLCRHGENQEDDPKARLKSPTASKRLGVFGPRR